MGEYVDQSKAQDFGTAPAFVKIWNSYEIQHKWMNKLLVEMQNAFNESIKILACDTWKTF